MNPSKNVQIQTQFVKGHRDCVEASHNQTHGDTREHEIILEKLPRLQEPITTIVAWMLALYTLAQKGHYE